MKIFYKEFEAKRKGQKTRLQTDQKFKQKSTFDLTRKYNIDMFPKTVRGNKAFAAKQKLREMKKGIFRLKDLEKNFKKNEPV